MKALVAVDLRDASADVVTKAIPWLAHLGAVADLVYADTWRAPLETHLPFSARGDLLAMTAEDEATLAQLAGGIPAENRGHTRVIPGLPGEVTAKLAPDYDVVVVSTHGRTGLAHWWLGSVAERIVRMNPKSVLVVRNPPTVPGRVLYSVGLEDGVASPPLEAVLRWAGGATIDLLHVDESFGRDLPTALPYMVGPQSSDIVLREAERHRALADAALTRLRDEHLPADQRGQILVGAGSPAAAILERAASYDLVVVGTHGRTGVTRALLGSVAERVVQRCTRSVLVLRAS